MGKKNPNARKRLTKKNKTDRTIILYLEAHPQPSPSPDAPTNINATRNRRMTSVHCQGQRRRLYTRPCRAQRGEAVRGNGIINQVRDSRACRKIHVRFYVRRLAIINHERHCK